MIAEASTDTILEPLGRVDAAELLAFENENRAFFETGLPGRGDAYYHHDHVARTIRASVEERERGLAFMYVLRDAHSELVGRLNVFDVTPGPSRSAELGYRVGERHQGRGHATRGVRLALAEMFDGHGLRRIVAATAPMNVGSQVVLLKNGFEFWGRARRVHLVHGVWQDSVHFERHREDAASG
jgi:[ribosomal protein S5]-alanine N-acetyltransferase